MIAHGKMKQLWKWLREKLLYRPTVITFVNPPLKGTPIVATYHYCPSERKAKVTVQMHPVEENNLSSVRK